MHLRLKIVILATAVHLLLAGTSLVYSYGATMARFDEPGISPPLLENVAAVAATVLLLPVRLLWTSWASTNLPNIVEWLAFVANSVVWGLAVAGVFAWRKQRSATSELANGHSIHQL